MFFPLARHHFKSFTKLIPTAVCDVTPSDRELENVRNLAAVTLVVVELRLEPQQLGVSPGSVLCAIS